VRAHGGDVTVTTSPGEGCCFRVTLPRVSDVPAHV
jgi:two-component system, OmpR family, sensor kinase